MKRSMLALMMAVAFAWAGAPVLADGADAAKVKGKANAEKAAKKAEDVKEAGGKKAREAKEAGETQKEEAERTARREQGEAEDAVDDAEEDASEAAEEAAEAAGKARAAKGGERDVPPGMAKRDAHPSTGKGSEKGQESRAKQEKSWWNFWE